MDLAHLERCYAALSPTTPSLIPCFPDPKLLSRPESQRFLAENLSQYDIAGDSQGSKTWKKVFWRRVVKTIEAGFEQRRQEGQSIEDEVRRGPPKLRGSVRSYLYSSSATSTTGSRRADPGAGRSTHVER